MDEQHNRILQQMDAYEEIIKQFLFYDEELALQTLFSITTIKISHAGQFWCHHHKTYIGDPKNPKAPLEQYDVKKNNCSRHVGIDHVKGNTYYKNKKDYRHILYIMNADSKIFPVDQFDKSHTYYCIKFYGKHDSDINYPCQEAEVIRYKFSAQEEKLIHDNIKLNQGLEGINKLFEQNQEIFKCTFAQLSQQPISSFKASNFRHYIPKALTVTHLREIFSVFGYPEIIARNHSNKSALMNGIAESRIQEVLLFNQINQNPTPNSGPNSNMQDIIIDITSDSEQGHTMNGTMLDQNQTQILIDEQVYGSDSEILSEISDQSVNSTILNPVSERRLIALQKHDELMKQIQNASWVEEEDLEDINMYLTNILKKQQFKSDNPKHNSKGSAKRLLSAQEQLIKNLGRLRRTDQ
ncbi:Conserved_hypothetical protein [Hexamita inflata]|uniref:Uncharacterized protein n=1 Tax=Hexamita inflata TaxID=28002 RepID=A0AA86NRI3_9EUKA|nr:Conserved hypothetical protein [Hexamita inflata]